MGPVLCGAIVYGCTPALPRAASVASLSGTAASRTCLQTEHAGHDSNPLARPDGRAVRTLRPSSENGFD